MYQIAFFPPLAASPMMSTDEVDEASCIQHDTYEGACDYVVRQCKRFKLEAHCFLRVEGHWEYVTVVDPTIIAMVLPADTENAP